jgi:hypothetical protein
VEFRANNIEERNRWYSAMLKAVKDNEVDSHDLQQIKMPNDFLHNLEEARAESLKIP